MLPLLLHDLIGPGQEDGGSQEGHMDEDLPFQMLRVFIGHIHKPFQQVNA